MVTQFVLRKQKKNATGECPVHLIIYFDGARLTCATGEKCKPADWNVDRQQFRRSYLLAEDTNRRLARLAPRTARSRAARQPVVCKLAWTWWPTMRREKASVTRLR